MDYKHLTEVIIQPVLKHMGLYSLAAERLVLYTACQESHLKWLKQLGMKGIGEGSNLALGIYQMERNTHDDCWLNFLNHKKDLAKAVRHFEIEGLYDDDNFLEMAGNLYYATAMCRIKYFRVKEKLPAADDLVGLARYWKRYYNTYLGAGTVEEFVRHARQFGGAV